MKISLPFKPHHSFRRKVITSVGIGLAVVSFWRGAWGLMDLYLFPNDQTLSFTFSLIIGLGALYISHYIVQELM